jgi:hypothetical protein
MNCGPAMRHGNGKKKRIDFALRKRKKPTLYRDTKCAVLEAVL